MNTSGIDPLEFNVIVRPDKVEERTKGGLYLPDETKERDQFSTLKGELIALSDLAFQDIYPADKPRPAPGERVMFSPYAGKVFKGDDGEDYRIMKDKDVLGVVSDGT